MYGRLFSTGDFAYSSIDDSKNSFWRAGGEVRVDNPSGFGGQLHADVETIYRTETDDRTGADLLVHQLSYARGGTRFAPSRLQFGRFVQHGMPEFGIVDGAEWTHRFEGGHRVGASFGFMPELDDDVDTFDDLQIAAYYTGVNDRTERLRWGIGYQKTFHRGRSDRDLIVLKSSYLPTTGWTFHSTAWVDLYHGSNDTAKSGIDLTQLVASVGRRFEGGSGVQLDVRRFQFPDVLRNEFYPPITPAEVADNRNDRVLLSGWRTLESGSRIHGRLGAYDDESDDGASGEVGFDWRDPFGAGTRMDLTAFATIGDQSTIAGGRVAIDSYSDHGSRHVFYELHNVHFHRYPDDGDDLLQQRLSGRQTWNDVLGGNLSLQGTVQYWEEDWQWSIGFWFERTF